MFPSLAKISVDLGVVLAICKFSMPERLLPFAQQNLNVCHGDKSGPLMT